MKTLITAQSGADGTPENSREFLCHSLSLPVDALEVDVGKRPSEPGSALASPTDVFLSWESLRRTVSSLSDLVVPGGEEELGLREVMRMAAGHPPIKLHCDLKEPGLEEAVCALALECGMAGRLVLSGAADAALWARSTLLRRTAELYLNIEDYIPSFFLGFREVPAYDAKSAREILAVCGRTGARIVHIRQDMVTRRFIERLAERGVGVSAWTVDNPEDLRWFVSRGAANLFTRDTAAALAIRG